MPAFEYRCRYSTVLVLILSMSAVPKIVQGSKEYTTVPYSSNTIVKEKSQNMTTVSKRQYKANPPTPTTPFSGRTKYDTIQVPGGMFSYGPTNTGVA